MHHRSKRRSSVWLLAAVLVGAAPPSFAQSEAVETIAASPAVEAYIRARTAYEQEAEAYWQSIADKRRGRANPPRRLCAGAPAGLPRPAASARLRAAAPRSRAAAGANPDDPRIP